MNTDTTLKIGQSVRHKQDGWTGKVTKIACETWISVEGKGLRYMAGKDKQRVTVDQLHRVISLSAITDRRHTGVDPIGV